MRIDVSDVERGYRRLQSRFPQVASRAINRSATSARVVMVREVATDMGLRQGDVKPAITTTNATPSRLHAEVVATGKRIPLIKFNARDKYPRGVVARLQGGRGTYPDAFVRTMRSGHVGVFKRRQAARLPIVELHGPSVVHVFEKKMPLGAARASEQLIKNLAHEMSRLSA